MSQGQLAVYTPQNMRQVNRQVSYVTNILLNEIVLVPHQSFVTFKMVLLDADVAANLVAFGTPWGQT